MKLEAKYSPRALQMSGRKSGRKSKSAARNLPFFLLFLSLFAVGGIRTASAAPAEDPVTQVDNLASQNLNSAEFSTAVAQLVKDNPKEADEITAEAVKDKPKYACDIVKACILALQPAGGGNIDPQEVASMVVAIVRAIQSTNPDIVRQVVDCAVSVDHDAAPFILNGILGLFNGPHSPNRPNWDWGQPGPVQPGTSPRPTRTPTPPRTPTPVTQSKNI